MIQAWFAPDITNDKSRGLGNWTVAQVVKFLKTGHNEIAAATGPMGEEVTHGSSKMTDADLVAMATYLKDQPGRANNPAPLSASDPAMKAGQAIYRDTCSACHGIEGDGVPMLIPSLAKSSAIHSDDPTTQIRIVERGVRSVGTDQEPTAPGMPSFSWQLKDAQVAAVLTYIRNSWGGSGPP